MLVIKIYEHENDSSEHKFKETQPECMTHYIEKYGEHFNEKLCNFAVSKMSKYSEVIKPIDKDTVDTLLEAYSITLDHNKLWDYVFVANMCKADFYGSSIADELHLAKYIKDVIDDDDAYDGIVFNRWYSDMYKKDIDIDWKSMCEE